MAWLEKDSRTGIYKLGVHLGTSKIKKSLQTTNKKQAEAIRGTAESTLAAIEQGWISIPDGSDVLEFLITGGKNAKKLTIAQPMKLGAIFEHYFSSLPHGALEDSTISLMRIHERQLYKFFKESYQIQSLTTADIQRYVERRSKDKGLRGRPVTANTIKKALITLRTVWNWGVKHGHLTGRFPLAGVIYPKTNEKHPFQTWTEIERQISRGLKPAEEADLWDCLFLTLPEIDDLMAYVKEHATHSFLYPMILTAAHTGARRSELVRSRLNDIDFAAGVMTIHERKRNQSMRTTRRVPISPTLENVLRAWIENHPGSNSTFVLPANVTHSRKSRSEVVALTLDEAHDHFKRTLEGSKWEKLRGWHVFRHSFCSNCAAAGIDQRIINAWVGHQTEDMVRRYRHLIPHQQQAAIQRVFGGVKSPA